MTLSNLYSRAGKWNDAASYVSRRGSVSIARPWIIASRMLFLNGVSDYRLNSKLVNSCDFNAALKVA